MPWSCGFRLTFRLFREPDAERDALDVFLASDGDTQDQVLGALPYDTARATGGGNLPDRKRYRDGRQMLRTVGLVYDEQDKGTRRVRVTPLGHAVRRWRPIINERNARTLGWHAARALAACQLRNPTGEGRRYPEDTKVFPFAYIWRAMLELGGRITSDELNRAIFHTKNELDLRCAIQRIRKARETGDTVSMGPEVVESSRKNDRVLVWMSWASFGWSLIGDKRTSGGGAYEIMPRALPIIRDAASLLYDHKEFDNEAAYVSYVSDCAGVPVDLR